MPQTKTFFWDKAHTSERWKIRVFDSISKSIDRSITNQRVIDILRDNHQICIDLFSQTWSKRKLKLFGRILRTSSDDPLRQVLFEYNTFIPRIEYRRPGKPRTSWLCQVFKEAFEMLGRVEEYDYDNPEHQNFVLQKAAERQGVFA